LHLTQMQC